METQKQPNRSNDATGSFTPNRLAEVLEQYLADLHAGRAVSREAFLAKHANLAAELEPCLAGLEFIQKATVADHPTQLGDFRVIREVGRGGMGVVYEAEQISLKRHVALKVLRFGAAPDTDALKRFQREAETVARLHHTNIVPIFAVGEENGVHYYAMQFIEGESLADRAKSQGACDPRQVAGWGLQAADALVYAHERGVVHRDIKPSNLLIDQDGIVWVTDFGLAKRIDEVTLTVSGALLGTPRYMSPEQAQAAKIPVDHRTDLYSLGASLYELVTGNGLFPGTRKKQESTSFSSAWGSFLPLSDS
jgi:serine/threonine protein kinase